MRRCSSGPIKIVPRKFSKNFTHNDLSDRLMRLEDQLEISRLVEKKVRTDEYHWAPWQSVTNRSDRFNTANYDRNFRKVKKERWRTVWTNSPGKQLDDRPAY